MLGGELEGEEEHDAGAMPSSAVDRFVEEGRISFWSAADLFALWQGGQWPCSNHASSASSCDVNVIMKSALPGEMSITWPRMRLQRF